MVNIDFDQFRTNSTQRVEENQARNETQNGEKKIGSFIQVKNNEVLIIENKITGNIKTKGKGLHFCIPGLYEKTIIYTRDQVIDYKEKKYRSKEEYDIIVDTAITYKIINAKKYYIQKNALQQLKVQMNDIFKRLITDYSYDDLSKLKVNLNDNEFDWINDEIDNIAQEYGIKVTKLTIERAELTEELKKSREENKLTAEKNKRNELEARSRRIIAQENYEIDKLKADGKKYELEQRLNTLAQIMETKNLTANELSVIKELLRDSKNITIIENNSRDNNNDILNYAALNSAFNESKNTYDDNQGSKNNIVNDDYEQVNTPQRKKVKIRRKK